MTVVHNLKGEGLYELRWGLLGPYPFLIMTAEEVKKAQIEPNPEDGLYSFSQIKEILVEYYEKKAEAWSKLKESQFNKVFKKVDTLTEEEMLEVLNEAGVYKQG